MSSHTIWGGLRPRIDHKALLTFLIPLAFNLLYWIVCILYNNPCMMESDNLLLVAGQASWLVLCRQHNGGYS